MPRCGSQVPICDVPVRFDDYVGCSHSCKYCFTRRKMDEHIGQEAEIEMGEGVQSLENFINGDRRGEVSWVDPDWKIPVHIGGMSDPLQPLEREQRRTLKCLKLLARTRYPFIISTKGIASIDKEYLDLWPQCNVCFQVSLVSPNYDVLEPGAPPFAKRLEIIRVISCVVPRLIVRIQPYMVDQLATVLQTTLPAIREAGAYGLVIEGMKFFASKPPGTISLGSDFVYPKEILLDHFLQIREKAKSLGLAFYCGENRLRTLGDSLTCCGCGGMEGFRPNTFNLNHIYAGENPQPTPAQKAVGNTVCYKTLTQTCWASDVLDQLTFESVMRAIARSKFGYKIMGLETKDKESLFF